MTDPIADMFSRMKSGMGIGRDAVDMPHSRIKEAIAAILLNEGYINKFDVLTRMNKKYLRIALKYRKNKKSVIVDIKRISRPGCRVYKDQRSLPRVQSGFGVSIVSTSKGLMTDEEARAAKLGGEVICKVW
jgi:small subunit ribosomal protein S8